MCGIVGDIQHQCSFHAYENCSKLGGKNAQNTLNKVIKLWPIAVSNISEENSISTKFNALLQTYFVRLPLKPNDIILDVLICGIISHIYDNL